MLNKKLNHAFFIPSRDTNSQCPATQTNTTKDMQNILSVTMTVIEKVTEATIPAKRKRRMIVTLCMTPKKHPKHDSH